MIRNLDGVRSALEWDRLRRPAERRRADEGMQAKGVQKVISPGGDEERETRGHGERQRVASEHGTERLLAKEVDEDLTDLLFQDPPPPQAYPEH